MSSHAGANLEISFGQRLADEAQRARELAIALPPGKMRDALLEKARLADLAERRAAWEAEQIQSISLMSSRRMSGEFARTPYEIIE